MTDRVVGSVFIKKIGSFLARVYRVMDGRAGKFVEHERSVNVNSSFLSALQTSRVHQELDIHTAKSVYQFFYNKATRTRAVKHVLFVNDCNALPIYGKENLRILLPG